MEHFVPLSRLPEGLTFPAEFQDRIHFDASRHRLVFRGFMRKSDYDALARLSGDLTYLDALQHLFSAATFDPPPATRRRKLVAVAGLVIAAALATGFLFQVKGRLPHDQGTSSTTVKQ